MTSHVKPATLSPGWSLAVRLPQVVDWLCVLLVNCMPPACIKLAVGEALASCLLLL